MSSETMFFGSHNIDFKNRYIEEIEYHTITALRKIPIQPELYNIMVDEILSNYLGVTLSFILSIDKW